MLLLDGARNFPSPLDAFFGTFLLQLPLGDESGDVCTDIGANLFRGTKGCRLSAKSLGWATGRPTFRALAEMAKAKMARAKVLILLIF